MAAAYYWCCYVFVIYIYRCCSQNTKFKISGEGGVRSVQYAVGKVEYTETPNQFDVTDTEGDSVKVMSHGVHEIEAWLSVDGTDVESEHIVSQVMVVSDPDNKTPYIMLNKIVESLVNWTSVQFSNGQYITQVQMYYLLL